MIITKIKLYIIQDDFSSGLKTLRIATADDCETYYDVDGLLIAKDSALQNGFFENHLDAISFVDQHNNRVAKLFKEKLDAIDTYLDSLYRLRLRKNGIGN